MPCAGDDDCHSSEKPGLVLDVLELHALGAPDEHRVRVRRVDDVRDLRAGLLRTRLPVVCGLDEHSEMVEQWALGIAGIAGPELDERAGHLQPRVRRRFMPSACHSVDRALGIGGSQRDVIEVVVDIGLGLDEADPEAVADLEPLLVPVRQGADGPLEARHAQADLGQRPRLASRLVGEQRELAVAGVRADEREALRALDDVHPEMGGREVRDRITVFHPERYVVEPLELHVRRYLRDWLVLDVVLERVLVREPVDLPCVGEGVVDLHERLPLLRQGVLGEDRLDRAFRLAGAAVDALLGVDDEDPLVLVDAVDGTDVHARAVFDVDAGLSDDVRHDGS